MKIESLRSLRGPNLWSNHTSLEAVVRFEGSFDLALVERVARRALDFQVAVGSRVSFSEVRRISDRQCRLVVQYAEEEVGKRALELAVKLPLEVPVSEVGDLPTLKALAEEVRLGPSTGSIANAAERRGIPARRMTDGSLVQFGFGSRRRRIWAAETDRTSAIGEAIAQDKELTKSLLATIGVPVPEGRVCKTAEQAWAAAQAIGLPVAIKPRKGNQGKGVSTALDTREAVVTAHDIAVAYDGETIVERHLFGSDHRLLVIGDKLIAAARREPPSVVGNGRSTIAELVAEENKNPLRGDDHSTSLSKLRLDAIGLEHLAELGLTADSVPAAGQKVSLRKNANLSTGGSATDVTDTVHPEVAARAIEAARMVGLDVAGIDVVATRIDQPLEVTRGAIVEVNAAPGLRMHLEPSAGKGRDVGQAIVDMMFPPGDDARIPIVSVTGTNGKTTTTRCISHILASTGLRVGMTCTDGIYVEGRRIDTGDCSGPKSARAVLAHPRVDAAVLETARGGILREGLGFDLCDVAIVTNVGEGDHLGLNGIDEIRDLARVKAVPVRAVSARGAAVLNADDPLVVEMAKLCRGTVVYFSRNPASPVLAQHRAAGGTAVTVIDGQLSIVRGRQVTPVARVDQLPLTLGGRVGFQVDNLLASVAAAHWLGIPVEAIRLGVRTFTSDIASAPGRFNVLTHQGSTIVLDYGHNASALIALHEALAKFPHKRRKVVYTAAGDRRDIDIKRQAELLAGFFDEIYIYEDQCTRGRADGEIIRLMREGFEGSSRAPRVLQAPGEMAAIGAAIAKLEPGDLLLCQVDQVEEALAFVSGMLKQAETSSRPVAQMAAHFAAALMVVLGGVSGAA
ncbi:MAG TPA: cyanophycin synthetase [Polyangiaceae bacterium]|nr:cyanophycin synthetase [Polyangiaceae bacterium]